MKKRNNPLLIILCFCLTVLVSCKSHEINPLTVKPFEAELPAKFAKGNVVGVAKAEGGDGQLYFSLANANIENAFEVDAFTGEISVSDSGAIVDFLTGTDGDHIYTATLTVSDGVVSVTASAKIHMSELVIEGR